MHILLEKIEGTPEAWGVYLIDTGLAVPDKKLISRYDKFDGALRYADRLISMTVVMYEENVVARTTKIRN